MPKPARLSIATRGLTLRNCPFAYKLVIICAKVAGFVCLFLGPRHGFRRCILGAFSETRLGFGPGTQTEGKPMAKIIIADNPLNEISVARELLPPSLERSSRATAPRNSRPPWPTPSAWSDSATGPWTTRSTRSAPKLKLVQLLSAGYDRCDIEAARRAGVPICNNGGANSTAVSEHAILLMLAVCRRIVWQHTNVASGRWRGNNVERRQALRTERPHPGYRRARHHRQEDRPPRAGVRHGCPVLRHRPPDRGTGRRPRRSVRAVRGSACAPPTSCRCMCR